MTPTPLGLSPRFSTTLPAPKKGPSGPSTSLLDVTPARDVSGESTEGLDPLPPRPEQRPKGTKGRGRAPWKHLIMPKVDAEDEGLGQTSGAVASQTEAQSPSLSASSLAPPCSQQADWDPPHDETTPPIVEQGPAHTGTSSVPPDPPTASPTPTPPSEVPHGEIATPTADAEDIPAQVEGNVCTVEDKHTVGQPPLRILENLAHSFVFSHRSSS